MGEELFRLVQDLVRVKQETRPGIGYLVMALGGSVTDTKVGWPDGGQVNIPGRPAMSEKEFRNTQLYLGYSAAFIEKRYNYLYNNKSEFKPEDFRLGYAVGKGLVIGAILMRNKIKGSIP